MDKRKKVDESEEVKVTSEEQKVEKPQAAKSSVQILNTDVIDDIFKDTYLANMKFSSFEPLMNLPGR